MSLLFGPVSLMGPMSERLRLVLWGWLIVFGIMALAGDTFAMIFVGGLLAIIITYHFFYERPKNKEQNRQATVAYCDRQIQEARRRGDSDREKYFVIQKRVASPEYIKWTNSMVANKDIILLKEHLAEVEFAFAYQRATGESFTMFTEDMGMVNLLRKQIEEAERPQVAAAQAAASAEETAIADASAKRRIDEHLTKVMRTARALKADDPRLSTDLNLLDDNLKALEGLLSEDDVSGEEVQDVISFVSEKLEQVGSNDPVLRRRLRRLTVNS